MKTGDRVRLVAIPDDLPGDDGPGGLNTKHLFQRCLGRVFPIAGFNGLGHVELEVGDVNGQAPFMDSIWVESQCLVVEEDEN